MCDQKEHADTEGEVQMESFQSWMKIKSWR